MTNIHSIIHSANIYLCSLPSCGYIVVPGPMAFPGPWPEILQRGVGAGDHSRGPCRAHVCLGLRRPGQPSFVSLAFCGKQTPWGGRVTVKSPASFGTRVSEGGAHWRQHRAGCRSRGSWEGEATGFYPMSPGLVGGRPFSPWEGTVIPLRTLLSPSLIVLTEQETPNRAGSFLGEVAFQGCPGGMSGENTPGVR